MKLVLGTSNFGAYYGLGAKINGGGFTFSQLNIISKISNKSRIHYFDTSFNYKKSHKKISQLNIIKKKIITKISVKKIVNKKNFKKILKAKLAYVTNKFNLKLYALLLHDFYLLNKKESIKALKILSELKNEKFFSNTGISIYNPDEILKVWGLVNFDIIQVPLNVFDTRFEKFKYLKKLKKSVKIIARSCFLQGLLSMNKPLPKNLEIYKSKIMMWKSWCDKRNIDYVKACLHFLKNKKYLDFIIVGFDNTDQLLDIIKKFYSKKSIINFNVNITKKDQLLIDPRLWKKK